MCLAIPGKILSIDTEADPRMATVDFGGVTKSVCIDWVPEANVGAYVIVHVGFALNVIDEEEANRTLTLFREMQDAERTTD